MLLVTVSRRVLKSRCRGRNPGPDRHRRGDLASPPRRAHHRAGLGPGRGHARSPGTAGAARRLTNEPADQAGGRGEPQAALRNTVTSTHITGSPARRLTDASADRSRRPAHQRYRHSRWPPFLDGAISNRSLLRDSQGAGGPAPLWHQLSTDGSVRPPMADESAHVAAVRDCAASLRPTVTRCELSTNAVGSVSK
jgi:hypothetical protein